MEKKEVRLIDAKFAQHIANVELSKDDAGTVQWVLSHTPTIEAEPVVHARWVRRDIAGEDPYECSYCGNSVSVWGYRRCPDCGAKMDLKD